MQIRIRETGAVVYENEFRAMYPDTSFPSLLTVELLDSFSADPVLNAPQPTLAEFEIAALDGAVQDSLGNWMQNWVVRPMFTEYTDDEGVTHSVEGQQASYTAAALNTKRQSMIVTPFQAKAALLQAGLLDDVIALMADPATDPLVKLAWDTAIEYRRLSPAVLGLATALGWTDTDLDDLFDVAKGREA
ncbi:MAG: hypothetical protein ACR2IJ_04660 [Fluviibacter sp.]